jgi:Uma2 family endonuclease
VATLITDRRLEDELRAAREASGADRWDEVWEGVYIMPPMPNNEHQTIVVRFGSILVDIIERPLLGQVFVGVNVSDREVDWDKNYRVPDVAAFLNDTKAKNCNTHWCGGPDLVIEVLSPYDQARAKLPFYGKVGVRELLLIDRDPWALELYELRGDELVQAARIVPGQAEAITGTVVPLVYRLQTQKGRPAIEVSQPAGGQRWLV